VASKSWTTKVRETPVDNLKKLRADLPKAGGQRLVTSLAGKGKALIQARTARGVGAGNKPFAPYRDYVYRAPIEKRPPGYPRPTGGRDGHIKTGKALKNVVYMDGYAGYKVAIGMGRTPQLSVSGRMLGAISITTQSAEVAFLFFAGREEAAKAHGHEMGTAPKVKRPFFDLSGYDIRAQMEADALKYIREIAKAAKVEFNRRGK
jgi:hypothetical protein